MTLYCSEASDLAREPDTPGLTAGLFGASEDHIRTAVDLIGQTSIQEGLFLAPIEDRLASCSATGLGSLRMEDAIDSQVGNASRRASLTQPRPGVLRGRMGLSVRIGTLSPLRAWRDSTKGPSETIDLDAPQLVAGACVVWKGFGFERVTGWPWRGWWPEMVCLSRLAHVAATSGISPSASGLGESGNPTWSSYPGSPRHDTN